MSIQAIDRTSVHRLTSGQVVVDLQTAVKELVENALDAGATSVDITFRDSGVEAIEVKDNGKGIDEGDWEGIALKHHTSKLASFADLAAVQTLGFRGEALSSLCGVATLSMVTSTAATAPKGTTLSFTSAGACVPEKKVARERGTTVKVERLFEHLPVRRNELVKNAQRELGKALALLQAHALVNTGVRFEARNVTKGKTLVQLKTTASTSLRTAFSYIFSPKDLPSLLDLDLTIEVPTEKSVMKRLEDAADESTVIHVKGLISKPSTGHGRTAGNRQFFFINGRPFQPAKVAKAFNEVYKSFNANQFPCVVADFQLAPDAYDVNVSPDKRTIFLHSEGNLLAALKQELSRFFDPQQARFEMKEIGKAKKTPGKGKGKAAVDQEDDEEEEAQSTGGEEDEEDEEGEDDLDERPRKRRKSSDVAALDSPSGSTSHPALAPMDIDLDASSLVRASSAHASASPHPSASNEANLLAAFPDDLPDNGDEGSSALPDPPAPLKRALCTQSSSQALETPRARSRSRSPIAAQLDSGHGRARSSSAAPDEAALQPPSQPLFRATSPTPRPASPRSPSPRSPSPAVQATASASTSGSVAKRQQLRQPTLSFLSGGASAADLPRAGGGASAGRKGRAKGKGGEQPRVALQSHLKRFLRGSQAVGEGEVDEEEEAEGTLDEEDEQELGAEEQGDEEQQGDAEEDGEVALDERDETVLDDSPGDADNADEDDAILVVEDSYRAPSPSLAAPPGPTQPLGLAAASCVCVHGSQEEEEDDDDDLEISEVAPGPSSKAAQPVQPAPLPFGAAPAEVAGTVVAADTDLSLDFAALSAAWSTPSAASAARPAAGPSSPRDKSPGTDGGELAGAAIGEREDAAEAVLSRIVSKDDFARMEIVGQFNLGFIIARRRVEATTYGSAKGKERAGVPEDETGETHDDLFIVDQHASDEKYNFEKLQAETVIQSQRLIAPRILNLPSADELTAMEHVDLLRFNGFDVLVDEDADVGERVKLIAQPVSKDTVFDTGDFEELVDLIGSRSGNEVVRPSKARRMFASRACRKSVMVGRALNAKQMTQILRNMSGMDQPWACPHGRPTMRWLASLSGPSAVSDPRFDVSDLCSAFE